MGKGYSRLKNIRFTVIGICVSSQSLLAGVWDSDLDLLWISTYLKKDLFGAATCRFLLQLAIPVKSLKPLLQKSRSDQSFCYKRGVTGRSFSTHMERSSKAQKSEEKSRRPSSCFPWTQLWPIPETRPNQTHSILEVQKPLPGSCSQHHDRLMSLGLVPPTLSADEDHYIFSAPFSFAKIVNSSLTVLKIFHSCLILRNVH